MVEFTTSRMTPDSRPGYAVVSNERRSAPASLSANPQVFEDPPQVIVMLLAQMVEHWKKTPVQLHSEAGSNASFVVAHGLGCFASSERVLARV